MIKISAVRKASVVSDRAFRAFCAKDINIGQTERALARALSRRLRASGSEKLPFPLIVAFGKNAAEIHHKPNATRLKPNSFILVDFGATVDGFCSDCTRMIVVGKPPSYFQERYALVLHAHHEAIRVARPGITGATLDAVARSIMKKHGLGKRFLHTLGHGIGRKVHERPSIGPKSQTQLDVGMTFTIEPGIYDKRWGGIRIEDTVVMTKAGIQKLTRLPTSYVMIS